MRLQQLMSAKIFDKLKESQTGRLSAVEVVTGDITKEQFGLSQPDMDKLCEEVEVVFHSAATIKFDEKLTEAVKLNVGAVYTLMELCKLMKKLQVISNFMSDLNTFSNIILSEIDTFTIPTRPRLGD